MNRKITFLISVILVCTVFLLCGCKKDTASSSSDISLEASAPSASNNNADTSWAEPEDTLDPENVELGRENGTEINAENLQTQSGKANGIDVSKWQGKINWQRVKAQGIDFAVIRVGYRAENGSIYKDPNADYNIQQADKAGILVGVYFFSTATNTAEALEEAKWTASQIESYPISYPVVYDCEGYLSSSSRMYGLTNAQRTQNAAAFLSHIESLGYEGMLYASKNELVNNWDTAKIEKDFKIWIARYTTVPYPETPVPDYSGKFDMWQYTNMGKIDGIEGNADMVVSYFVREKAKPKSDKTVTEAEPPAPVDKVYTTVNDSVTAKDSVNLRDSASTNSNIIATLNKGEFLTRTAVGTNGWSKLIYSGNTVYAITSYLTTDPNYTHTAEPQPDDVFTAVNEQVTAKNETNLRTAPSTGEGSTVVHILKNGEFLTRTGVNSKGWSKLIYNGQTVYAVSSYLTTESGGDSERPEIVFTKVNEQVTAKNETNLRSLPTTDSPSEIVYLLKNGEYLTRTGTSAQGWSRLELNGQTVYAVSSYLTTEVISNE